MIGCGAPAAKRVATPAQRITWLRAEVARAEILNQSLHGAYLPRAVPGASLVCSIAIQIDAWYGVTDDRWELTRATTMLPVRRSSNLREELARIGIRDCVLDVNR